MTHARITGIKRYIYQQVFRFYQDHKHCDSDGLAELVCDTYKLWRNNEHPIWIKRQCDLAFAMVHDVANNRRD